MEASNDDESPHVDVIDSLFAEKIAAAEDHDVAAARWLLQEFVTSVEAAKQAGIPAAANLHPALLDYFHGRFKAILQFNLDADHTLRLQTYAKKPGRPKTDDKQDLCNRVATVLNDHDAPNQAEAIRRVASRQGVSVNVVSNAWKKNPIMQLKALRAQPAGTAARKLLAKEPKPQLRPARGKPD